MRNFLTLVALLVYFKSHFAVAQSSRERAYRANDIEDSLDDQEVRQRLDWESGQNYPKIKPYALSAHGWDSVRPADRRYEDAVTTEKPDDMIDEFQSDLREIRKFAQNIRPVATSMRRSLHSRRGIGQNGRIVCQIIKLVMLYIIGAIEGSLPALKPITKYLRQFLEKTMG